MALTSAECSKSELDLFILPPTQTSVEYGQWVQYKPLSSLSGDAPIEFVVPGHGDEYLDLNQTLLSVKAKILQQDGTNLDATCDKVGPVNNFLHSMFSQVDVYLNQKLVSGSGNIYPYRCYIETLLNNGYDAKDSYLTSSLWYSDKSGHMDKTEDDNTGLVTRRAFFNSSRTVDMMGYIYGDIFSQNRYLLNGVELKVKLIRSRDTFCLMSKMEYNVKIVEASLLVRRVKISPTVLISHAKELELCSAKYPVSRVEVKSFTIPSGLLGKSIDNVYLGQMPKRVVIGLVSNTAFNGSNRHNPFNFQHYNVNFLAMYIDGQQVPANALQPDYTVNSHCAQCYHTLFSGTNINHGDCGNAISRTKYPNGYCLYAFDLTPDLSASAYHWSPVRRGSLRIEIKFTIALTEAVNCIVFGEFSNVIEVDKYRNVTVDYN